MTEQLPGDVIQPPPATVSDREDTTISAFTAAAYTASATVCGVAFTAHITGRALVSITAWLDNVSTTTGQTYASYRIGTGSTIGSGTQVVGPDDSRSILITASNQCRSGITGIVTGLTPGATYNAQMMHKQANATGDIAWREIIVAPAS